jgi:methionyl-tRNA formyltransferase
LKIVLLGHDDLPSLYALQRVISAAPQHDYSAFFSGDLPARPDTLHDLLDLASVDARLCAEFRSAGRLAVALLGAGTLPRPNSAAGLELLEGLEPDLVVSIRYRRILKGEAIAVPRLGVLNLHSGVLPDYKGVMATFWAMLNDEEMIGSTLHRIVDSGIDTGPVMGIRRVAADYRASYLANVLRLYGPGCDMIVEALQALETGKEPRTTAQEGEGRYFSTPEAADLERFTARSLVLADGRELAEIEVQALQKRAKPGQSEPRNT